MRRERRRETRRPETGNDFFVGSLGQYGDGVTGSAGPRGLARTTSTSPSRLSRLSWRSRPATHLGELPNRVAIEPKRLRFRDLFGLLPLPSTQRLNRLAPPGPDNPLGGRRLIMMTTGNGQSHAKILILQIGELPHKRKLHLPVRGIRTAEPAGSIQPDGMACARHSPDVHFGSVRDSI